jgi:RHS repeat-associated protein
LGKNPNSKKEVVDFFLESKKGVLDYYPFGSLQPNRHFSDADGYRYGFNGMEKDDEMHGVSGGSYDFGARQYDARLGRCLSGDPMRKKYPSWSSYNFALCNPVSFVDKNGEDVYILVYTSSVPEFKEAANTRAWEILLSEGFDATKDRIYIVNVNDWDNLQDNIDNIVDDAHNNGYGETVELGLWSHASWDGPIADKPSDSDDELLSEYGQLTQREWGNIKFNFGDNSCASFYGCNSFVFAKSFLEVQENLSFSAGQQSSSYPSTSKTERKPDIWDFPFQPIYFVGAEGGLGLGAYFGKTQPAVPMLQYTKVEEAKEFPKSSEKPPNVGFTPGSNRVNGDNSNEDSEENVESGNGL